MTDIFEVVVGGLLLAQSCNPDGRDTRTLVIAADPPIVVAIPYNYELNSLRDLQGQFCGEGRATSTTSPLLSETVHPPSFASLNRYIIVEKRAARLVEAAPSSSRSPGRDRSRSAGNVFVLIHEAGFGNRAAEKQVDAGALVEVA